MTGFENLVYNTAKTILTRIVQKEYAKIFENKSDEYTQELYEIIIDCCKEYEKLYPVIETDRIPFYKSATLIEGLLNYRLNNGLNEYKISNAILNDDRIIKPSDSELDNFFKLFQKMINNSDKLKKLNISINYKEEIFNISDDLKSLGQDLKSQMLDIKEEIAKKIPSTDLLYQEIYAQLDEIENNLEGFKVKTARERLSNLENRIKENEGIASDKRLIAKLLNLKADTYALLPEKDIHAHLLIRIYSLDSQNDFYKSNAAVAYIFLDEIELGIKLADEVLATNYLDIGGWLAKCFAKKEEYLKFLEIVPKSVKSKNQFKINLYQWLSINKKLISWNDYLKNSDVLDLDLMEPIKITYKSFHYNLLLCNYLLSKFYLSNTKFSSKLIYDRAIENNLFKHAYEILKEIYSKLLNSEIEEEYLDFLFHYYCCSYILTNEKSDIQKMEGIYVRMLDPQFAIKIQMMQGWNSLDVLEYHKKAIKLGEKSLNTDSSNLEVLLVLLSGSYLLVGDAKKYAEYFIKYLTFNQKVDENKLLNFINITQKFPFDLTAEDLDSLNEFIKEAKFEIDYHKDILQIFIYLELKIGYYSNEEIYQKLYEIKGKVSKSDENVNYLIGLFFAMTNYIDDAIAHIKNYFDNSTFSDTYILYCKLLYNSNGNKLELLGLLKKHRDDFPCNHDLFKIEWRLFYLQSKIKEANKISKKALQLFPSSEFFIRVLFIGLNEEAEIDEIKSLSNLITSIKFRDEISVINISQILIRVALYKNALEFLYEYAINKNNIQVRQAYIFLSHSYPKGLFNEYNEVVIDSYIKYQIDDNINFLHITEENKNLTYNEYFIGKRIGETFSIQKPLSGELKFVKVLRIMDKYLCLFEEIIAEVSNPLSGMSIEAINFKGNKFEDITSSLIETFGVKGSLEKERIEKEYEKYYSGQISFGEIVNSVFRRNLFDAYFILTNNNGKPFKGLTTGISNSSLITEEATFILDPTSLCLFYMLDKECNVVFKTKFAISPFLKKSLVKELNVTKTTDYSMSLSITIDKVLPYKYDDDFKLRRLNTFQNLINWLDNNCTISDIPERLNLIDPKETDYEEFFNIYIDNRLLIDRPNHFLLTDDLLYIKQFNSSCNLAISPLHYLLKFHFEEYQIFIDYLLRKNYVGIPLTATIFNNEFMKMLAGQENRFGICLENLRYNWNPLNNHINESITFIKTLFLNAFVPEKTRAQIILAIFQNLTFGMNTRLLSIIQFLIKREFRLLPIQEQVVLDIFNDVVGGI